MEQDYLNKGLVEDKEDMKNAGKNYLLFLLLKLTLAHKKENTRSCNKVGLVTYYSEIP